MTADPLTPPGFSPPSATSSSRDHRFRPGDVVSDRPSGVMPPIYYVVTEVNGEKCNVTVIDEKSFLLSDQDGFTAFNGIELCFLHFIRHATDVEKTLLALGRPDLIQPNPPASLP